VVGGGFHPALRQRGGKLLGGPPSGHIGDPRLVRDGDALQQRLVPAIVIVEEIDGGADVRPVECAEDEVRIAQAQAAADLLAHGRGRGRGQRERRRVTQLLDDGAESQVVGAEVVVPLGDAVGLVDHEQRRPGASDALEHRGVAQLLGRHERELELALFEPGERLASLAYADLRRELRSPARSLATGQRLDLVALEGQKR
jgi:hypothetical protein